MTDRAAMIDRLKSGERWDVLVIGGGATGLGVAVDAASRGYRTALVDGHDFAKGTSSRSTKLVHGGVRYLAQGNLRLVREALHERGVLRRIAPHLVRDLPFVVPAYSWLDLPWYGAGLKVYDLLAGRMNLAPSRVISAEEARTSLPTLRTIDLKGGIVYHDGQFDDARLAISLFRTFLDHGGVAANYVRADEVVHDHGRTTGIVAIDGETGDSFRIHARVVVNATGVYAAALRRTDRSPASWSIRPSRGVHIVLDRSFQPGDAALMIPKTDDGRVLFAIPWHGHVVVGTTDTPVNDAPIEPTPSLEEVEFLLDHAGRYLRRKPTIADVLSTFAGLRPLVETGHHQTTAAISREHLLDVSPSGLVTITGGKWTTYRLMAEQAVDRAAEVADLTHKPCVTETLRLHGWKDLPAEAQFEPYGSDEGLIAGLAMDRPELAEPIHPELPHTGTEVVWAAREEMARTVEDVLARRTRSLILHARGAIEAAPRVAELLAGELGRGPDWQAEQVEAFRAVAAGYLPSGLTSSR